MGRDLGIVGLRHAGDLLRLQDAADPAERHLQDRRRLGFEQPREFVLGGEPLAGRDRDRGGTGHSGHRGDVLRRHRLLEPERVVGLEPPGEADRARRRHLAVGADQQVALAADRGAQRLDEPLRMVERGKRELAGIERRIGPDGVELDRGET